MRIFTLLVIGLLGTVFSGREHIPLAKSDVESDARMKEWVASHPFGFKFPVFFEKFFIDKLVVNVDGFVLPPGHLWYDQLYNSSTI